MKMSNNFKFKYSKR